MQTKDTRTSTHTQTRSGETDCVRYEHAARQTDGRKKSNLLYISLVTLPPPSQ